MLRLNVSMDSTELAGIPEQIVTAAEMPVTKEQWEGLDKAESGSVKRAVLYNEGYEAGFNSAADDYVNGKVTLEIFEKFRTDRDITDFFAIGFEMGYFRKLAEIAVL